MSSAYAEETKRKNWMITVTGGSMFRMGEVPFDQAKSTVAVSSETLDREGVTAMNLVVIKPVSNQSFGNDTNTNWFRVRGGSNTSSRWYALFGLRVLSYLHTNVFGFSSRNH